MIIESVLQSPSAAASSGHWRVTGVFIVIQLIFLGGMITLAWIPLFRAQKRLDSIRNSLRDLRIRNGDREAARKLVALDQRVARAWSQSVDAQRDKAGKFDALEPEVAFDPPRLLPAKYNMRLDAAAPGLFTAFGILGTFVGLILGFRGIDPAAAAESIGGLIGGMTVAFVNSLVGVSLSIIWSFFSRVFRHGFDQAAGALQEEAEEWFDGRGLGDELRTGFSSMAAALQEVRCKLEDLRESTERSSEALLNGLSPKLAESMKVLVTTPFEQLTKSVEAFDQVVREAGEHQRMVSRELAESTASLAASKAALAESLATAQGCVAEFQASADRLREGTEEAAEIVRQAASASGALMAAVAETRAASERYGELGSALQETIRALAKTDEALQENAARFQSSSEHLERTVSQVRTLADEGITQSVAAVRGELQSAIEALLRGMEESSERAIRAHEAGSERVASAIDTQIGALVERVSTELSQIAAGLPAEVEAINRAMAENRLKILEAYRSSAEHIESAMKSTVAELTGKIAAELSALLARFPDQVKELSALMETTHARTIAAYQASSEQVIETVDERLSDLTDRLHGALATLTSRLPEEVSTVTQAMAHTTAQIRRSTRSMDDALRQLAVQTPQALAAQYKEFDSALATAMKHFSGTLIGWDSKIADLHRLSVALEAFVKHLEREHANKSGNGKAAEAVSV